MNIPDAPTLNTDIICNLYIELLEMTPLAPMSCRFSRRRGCATCSQSELSSCCRLMTDFAVFETWRTISPFHPYR
ncbi:hypothetical protein M758_3G175200 [Ceratodon purpureus]|uniref:Uncharacterized protein n=1 Tax=Ceratodon purpureus TaxID=3225 RepID=A0A8T0ILW9_CERPU|nr:hypothetical protein KC19_3G173100 [Ceratodon purpureus]KAG0623443.1 hypothetical protein M758_3G175200 [Ceratodon purpureus]